MSESNTILIEKYSALLRVLHWTAAVFTFLFVTGPIMVDLGKDDTLRRDLFNLHKSVGVIAIILLFFRLTVRLRSVLPPLPSSLQGWEVNLAHWGSVFIFKT